MQHRVLHRHCKNLQPRKGGRHRLLTKRARFWASVRDGNCCWAFPKSIRNHQFTTCTCKAGRTQQSNSDEEGPSTNADNTLVDEPGHVYLEITQLAGKRPGFDASSDKTTQFANYAASLFTAAARHATVYTPDELVCILGAAAAVQSHERAAATALFQLLSTHLDALENSRCSHALWATAKLQLEVPAATQQLVFTHMLPKLPTCLPRELATITWALATLRWNVPQGWMDVLLTQTEQRFSTFNNQDYANTAWGIVKLGWRVSDAWVNTLCLHARPKLENFKLQELCNLAWALARLSHVDTAMTVAIARSALSKVATVSVQPHQIRRRQQHLANLAWSMATLHASASTMVPQTDQPTPVSAADTHLAPVPATPLTDLAAPLTHLDPAAPSIPIPADPASLTARDMVQHCMEALVPSSANGQDIANLFWAAAVVGGQPSEQLLSQVFEASSSKLASFKPVELSTTLLALVRLGSVPPTPWLNAAAAAAAARFQQYGPRDFANVIWALTVLGYQPHSAWLEAFLSQSQHLHSSCTAQDVKGVLFALGRLQLPKPVAAQARAWCTSAMTAVSTRPAAEDVESAVTLLELLCVAPIATRDPELRREGLRRAEAALPQASSQQLARIAWAAAKLGNHSGVALVSKAVDAAPQHLPDMTMHDCILVATSLLSIRQLRGGQWARAFASRTQQLLPSATAAELSMLLYNLVRLSQLPARGWMQDFYAASLRLLHNCKLQDLANLLWAAGHCGIPPQPEWTEALLQQAQPQLPSFKPMELCAMLVGLAKLRHTPQRAWLNSFHAVATARFPDFSDRELANYAWALGLLGPAECDEPWMDSFLPLAHSRLASMQALDLACVIWGLAELGFEPSSDWVYDFLAAVSRAMKREQCNDHTLTMIQSALTKLGDAGFVFA